MALQLLGVLLLGGLAAAADDSSVIWWSGSRLALPCMVPAAERLQLPRRAPLPIDDDQPRRRNYQWVRDGEEVNARRISQNGSLEIPRRRGAGGEGVYQCSARHSAGIVLGYPVQLKYAYLEKQFSQHPENRTARVGQPVALGCSISSAPDASLTWLKDGGSLPDDSRFHVLENHLLISDVRKEDAGLYRCIASNVHANKTRASHRGRLEVEDIQELEPSWLPLQVERNLTVARGAKAVLPCPVVAWPRPEIIWELTPPGGRTGELDTTDQVLVLPRVELDQEGVYTCKVAGKSDLIQTFNISIWEPVVIITPPASKEALRASTVRLGCTASGRPEPTLTWYKDGELLVLAGRRKLLKSTIDDKIELVISSVTSDDAGVYQCFASNNHSTASAWATLSVAGSGAPAPQDVTCAPVDAKTVVLRWTHETPDGILAYTVHTAALEESGASSPGQPTTGTAERVTLERPLAPYRFQVRAYVKSVASDMSTAVVCQGQGVPIKLRKLPNNAVSVSWNDFADETPGVLQWMVQIRRENEEARNVTLPGTVMNYTLQVPSGISLLVRVLGTKVDPWLAQNLTLVPWTSTARAGEDLDDGALSVMATDLELTSATTTSASIRWHCAAADEATQTYSFIVCARRSGSQEDKCQESFKSSATIEGLEPHTEYEIRVQARVAGRALGGPFTQPFLVQTRALESDRFKDLTYEFVNTTAVRVSWGENMSSGAVLVRHTAQLRLPVEVWRAEEIVGNEILITGIDPADETYVMVTDAETLENSRILTIPPRAASDAEKVKGLAYTYINDGVKVSWNGSGRFRVRYAQDITAPLEQWPDVNVTEPQVLLQNLDKSKKTYVMVTTLGDRKSQVLTIPPPPEDSSQIYLIVGATCGVLLLALMLVAALCIWRRRKRNRSPIRSRRRRPSTAGSEEEGAELKDVGGRLANGGAARGAGEPLLNGRVHITENPTVPKTPNGKRKNVNYEAAFDVARYSDRDDSYVDHDTTAETTLDATSYDTSRLDDNMNARLKPARNDDTTPTLQPNG